MNTSLRIGIVDDHKLFRMGIAELIRDFGPYEIVFELNHGEELRQLLPTITPPDIILLDIEMPVLNGHQTAQWLRETNPAIKILALSMDNSEIAIINMIKAGVCGYILKDSEPAELRLALESVAKKGTYYSDIVSNALIGSLHAAPKREPQIVLTEKEITFLRYACTELTYKEVADKMNLAPRTIDGYREALFEKLGVKSRVGLVIHAIRNGIVKVD